ncbi:glutaredoxin-like protein [Ancylostoma caninum]|uniref:Glutaredoxin-like protein n=1 Tax=Ancylostoma caninum TaxID=29170 RepID=A0A368GDX2_ANCCA|nr:glutaredoxin-like protein [Ancylostoma caninum]
MLCLSRAQTITSPLLGRFLSSPFLQYSTGSQKVFTLYTTENCGLCAYFKNRLDAYRSTKKPDWSYVEKDLKTSPKEIFEKYKHDVPVLLYEDKLLLKHKFSGNRLEDRLLDIFPK